jgi:hypothetical protein
MNELIADDGRLGASVPPHAAGDPVIRILEHIVRILQSAAGVPAAALACIG